MKDIRLKDRVKPDDENVEGVVIEMAGSGNHIICRVEWDDGLVTANNIFNLILVERPE